jgi:signal recognition particle subunit SRP54
MLGMLPGIGKIKQRMAGAKLDDRMVKRQIAVIQSMTPKERGYPDLIKASRKQRIAKGAGVEVAEVNKILKQHQEAGRMVKQLQKLGKKGLLRQGLAGLMPPGGGGRGGSLPPGFGGGGGTR